MLIAVEISHFIRKTIVEKAKTYWSKEFKDVPIN
jgi:hypothetical protein